MGSDFIQDSRHLDIWILWSLSISKKSCYFFGISTKKVPGDRKAHSTYRTKNMQCLLPLFIWLSASIWFVILFFHGVKLHNLLTKAEWPFAKMWVTKKNRWKPSYFPLNPGCLIGILTISIMVYWNPHITSPWVVFHPLFSPNILGT